MPAPGRWERCVEHRKADVGAFFRDYFGDSHGRVGLVATAGFDFRSLIVTELLASVTKNVDAVFVREERPSPEAGLVAMANKNLDRLQATYSTHHLVSINVFGDGNAVVGGRAIVARLQELGASMIQGWSDVVIDASAFSIGISFPLIKFFLEQAARGNPRNVHVVIAASPTTDDSIVPIPSDFMTLAHGFAGGLSLFEANSAAKLWLPQLALGRSAMLSTIYSAINPDDVCPILPFPAEDPRAADRLIEHYLSEFESGWEVDARDIVYAAENDPKDLYRTLLRLHELRTVVFEDIGGSVMVLSPLGSKAMALGVLMAAYELELSVAYVESEGFDSATVPLDTPTPEVIHLWLAGDVYAANATPDRD